MNIEKLWEKANETEKKFEVTKEHIAILRKIRLSRWYTDNYEIRGYLPTENGYNEQVEDYAMEIIGTNDRKRVRKALNGIVLALEIIINEQTFEPGEYPIPNILSYYEYLRQMSRMEFEDIKENIDDIWASVEVTQAEKNMIAKYTSTMINKEYQMTDIIQAKMKELENVSDGAVVKEIIIKNIFKGVADEDAYGVVIAELNSLICGYQDSVIGQKIRDTIEVFQKRQQKSDI